MNNLSIVTNNINLIKTLTKKLNLNCKILNQKEFNKSKKQYDNLVIININLNDKINKIANKIFYINTNFEKDTIKNFIIFLIVLMVLIFVIYRIIIYLI